jgi:hypothetical protein
MNKLTHTVTHWVTKRIFQNVQTGLWYDGAGFRVHREKAFPFPTHVVVVDFRHNWPEVNVRWEDVQVEEKREVVDEVVFEGEPVWS